MTTLDTIDLADRLAMVRNDIALIDAAMHLPEATGQLSPTAATGLRSLCERIMDELCRLADAGKSEG